MPHSHFSTMVKGSNLWKSKQRQVLKTYADSFPDAFLNLPGTKPERPVAIRWGTTSGSEQYWMTLIPHQLLVVYGRVFSKNAATAKAKARKRKLLADDDVAKPTVDETQLEEAKHYEMKYSKWSEQFMLSSTDPRFGSGCVSRIIHALHGNIRNVPAR